MTKIFSQFPLFFPSVILITIYYYSTKLHLYNNLYPALGILNAYIFDHFLFLILFFAYAGFLFAKGNIGFSKRNLFIALGIFIFFLTIQLIFLNEVLYRYFAKDDYHQVVDSLNRPSRIHNALSMKSGFFYYQFSYMALLFQLFRYNTFLYNLIALAGMAFAGTVWFYLFDYLKKKFLGIKNNFFNVLIVLLIISLYLVSTSIMDIYTFMENSVAMGTIIAFVLLSILFYIFYLQGKNKQYFFLSYILILFLIKSADVRAAFVPLLLIFLEFLYALRSPREIIKNKNDLIDLIFRCLILFLPFLIKNESYFLPSGEGRFYGHSLTNFINFDRIYLVFSNTIPSFIPYTVWTYIYKIITFYNKIEGLPLTHPLNNILFTSGTLLYATIFMFTLVLNFRKINTRYIIFFTVAALVSMAFFMLFGNVDRKPKDNSYDLPYAMFADTPGSRYYIFTSIFIFTSLYLLVGNFFKIFSSRLKKITYLFLLLILSVFIVSDIIQVKITNKSMTKNTMVPLKTVTDEVLKIVPDDDENKVVYSAGGSIPVIQFWAWDGFVAMYRNTPPIYVVDEVTLTKTIKEKAISKQGFYTFYFNPETLEFKDLTEEYREKYLDLFDQSINP